MNIWKTSTVALAMGMTALAGRDIFTGAAASSGGAVGPDHIGFEWGEEQPHMEQALRDLRGARHSLEVAAEHKGGWRALALKHTDEAINETVRGIEYAKTHRKE
jgi:hypothetical protein